MEYDVDKHGNMYYEGLMEVGIIKKDVIKTVWAKKPRKDYVELITAYKFKRSKKEEINDTEI